jgi:hypothetical protein
MESSTTTEMWLERVAAWRASGEQAETFSRRGGYAASTLRWWASKLKREMAPPPAVAPTVQLARVVRTRPSVSSESSSVRRIVLEFVDVGMRIAVEPGADATTLSMVLDVVRGARR